jgi:hypothetical protein
MTTWQIGESGTTIALDGTGKGELTFTVTNAGTAADRAVLTITALDGAAEEWFAVPEPQRAVAPGASVLYPVGVSVPLGTAAGTYAMQGVAYSADTDPGESSVTSKRVTLTMGAPPPAKKTPWWIWLVIAAAVLLVVGVIAVLLTRGGDDGELRNEQPPRIAGLAEVGQQLTADPGEWSRDLDDIDYQWELCHAGDEVCDDLPGATGNEYTILPENADHEFRVRVRVVAGDEEATVRAGPTDLVPVLLANVAPSLLGGPAEPGQALTATEGEWSLPDAAISFQWQRCSPDLSACSPIEGAIATGYVVTEADVGAALRAEVTAQLAGATSTSFTPATGTVTPLLFAVPDVRDMSAGGAHDALSVNFRPVIVTYPSTSTSDCDEAVTDQNPAPGTMLPAGSEVTAYVPDYIDLSIPFPFGSGGSACS